MATYEQPNFAEIADAIDVDVALIAKHENLFEAAALWYRLARKRPERIVPSKLSEKLDRIAKSARRLFSSLAVSGLDEAADGPGNIEILAALVLAGQPNEDPIIEATRRIARLVEIIDGVAAADSDDPGQGFQFEGGHHSNRRRAVLPVGTFMGSQRW